METRDKRNALIEEIILELVEFAAALQALEPGWTGNSRCLLPDSEKLWLDPLRSKLDNDFAQKRTQNEEWQRDVAKSFASWINNFLGNKLPVGDVEHQFWMEMFEDEMDFDSLHLSQLQPTQG
jgi:CRISPR-associated protein Csy1